MRPTDRQTHRPWPFRHRMTVQRQDSSDTSARDPLVHHSRDAARRGISKHFIYDSGWMFNRSPLFKVRPLSHGLSMHNTRGTWASLIPNNTHTMDTEYERIRVANPSCQISSSLFRATFCMWVDLLDKVGQFTRVFVKLLGINMIIFCGTGGNYCD